MKSKSALTIFIFLVSELICLSVTRANRKPLYGFKITKPFALEETAEIINPGTPEEEKVVQGNKSVIYISHSNGQDYGVNIFTQYMANKNGNRVKSRFRLLLLDPSSPRLGLTALISTVGFQRK